MKRLVEIDALRALGVLLVIAIHVFATHSMLQDVSPLGIILSFSQSFFYIAVPLFLFISGYILTLKPNESPMCFYKKRLWHVLVPYTAVFLLYLLKKHKLDIIHLPPVEVFLEYILATSSEHLWFVPLIVQLYLLYPLLLRLMRHRTAARRMLAVTFALNLAFWLVGWWPSFFPNGLFFFCLGLYFRLHSQAMPRPSSRPLLLLTIILGSSAALFRVVTAIQFGELAETDATILRTYHALNYLYASMAVVWLFNLTRSHARTSRRKIPGLGQIAGCSYGMYLWHILFLSVFKNAYAYLQPQYHADAIYYLACFVFTALSSFAFVHTLSHIRCFHALVGFKSPRSVLPMRGTPLET